MKTSISILLVEDDEVDIMTIRRAFKELHIINPLSVVHNGLEALEYLRSDPKNKPGIILLDINMPKMNGIEFLREIKSKPEFKRIPVVVLTTSKDEQDKFESYNLCVAGYMIKPVGYDQFVEVIKTIHLYWDLCELADENQ